MKKILFMLLFLLTVGSLQADVVNNSGATGADSLTLQFFLLDSLGNLTDISSTDSIGVITFYPEGAVAYNTVILGNNSNIVSQSLTNIGTCYSYGIAVADIDGAAPSQGVYSWLLTVKDVSLGLTTTHSGTFQLYTSDDFNSSLDQLAQLDTTVSSRSAFDPATDSVNARANILAISNDANAADSLEALVDGESNFQLKLKQLYISNPDGSAFYASSQSSNGHGMYLESTQNGNGLFALNTGGGSGIRAEAGATGNGDGMTLIGHGTGNDLDADELFAIQDSVNNIIDSLSSSGAGLYAYKVLVLDTTSDTPVHSVNAYLRNLNQTILIASTRSNSNGELLFNLDAGSYLLTANAPGYQFTVFDTITVSSAGEDTLSGYPFDPGSPALPSLCRAFGYIYDVSGNPESQASVTASVPGGVAHAGQTIISPFQVSTTSDSLGYFYLDLIPSDSLLPSGRLYEISIAKKDGTILRQRVSIPSTTSWQISW